MARTLEQRLKALHAKREALQQRIAKLEHEQSTQLRKRQEKRERLVGKVVYALIQSGDWTEQRLLDLVDEHLTRATDRRLFGLSVTTTDDQITPSGKDTTSKKKTKSHSSDGDVSLSETGASEDAKHAVSGNSHAPTKKRTKAQAKLPETKSEDDLISEFNL